MRRLGLLAVVCTVVTTLVGPGCSTSERSPAFGDPDGGAPGPLLPDQGDAQVDAQARPCVPGSGTDLDGDGFTVEDGDCNDCDPNANPGALDVPGNGLDEDCSTIADDEPRECDRDSSIDSLDPLDGARALGLCRTTTAEAKGRDRHWGVISASYLKPDGTAETEPLSHGILPDLGPHFKPFEGHRMLALSSGSARRPDDLLPEVWTAKSDKRYTHGAPSGFPHAPAACPDKPGGTPFDGAAFELKVRVPTNARSLTFSHAFFTTEYPEWYCSNYNDVYIVLMTPKVTRDGNIAFDREGNGVSVNSAFLDICAPSSELPLPCPKGPALLEGTGFDAKSPTAVGTAHAATSWLTTTAPVKGGEEITLFFAIWDSADGALDSTIIADDFRWSAEPAAEPVTRVR